MYQRPYIKTIKTRIAEQRRFIQVIFGPRQVGKSTMINQLLQETLVPHQYVSADASGPAGTIWLNQVWEAARLRMAHDGTQEFLLVIDEIQKIENWSETTKANWDRDSLETRQLKVIILGSSRLLLQQGLTESLAGRFEAIYMSHWSYTEMHDAFGWDEKTYAWFGGYPGSASLISDESRWKAYIQNSIIESSISKDILMLTRVDKPILMKKLFELGCLYSGQILSFNKILGQHLDAGNTTTLAHYLELLHTAGLLSGLQKYSGNMVRERSSSPKFQVHNMAFISAQHAATFAEAVSNPAFWGRIVESVIGAQLINQTLTKGYDLFYWRKGNDEIDFVLKMKGKIIGLEIKSGNLEKRSGMVAFEKEMRPDKTILIGKSGIPWELFLKMDIDELL